MRLSDAAKAEIAEAIKIVKSDRDTKPPKTDDGPPEEPTEGKPPPAKPDDVSPPAPVRKSMWWGDRA